MKILVTGANGLLGNAFRRILGPDHVYHTRKDCDLLNFDDTFRYIKECVEIHGVDSIIHTAARVGGVKANLENNQLYFRDNYIINNNILKLSLDFNIQNFVNILSTCIFPDKEITYPLTADQIDLGPPHFSNHGYAYSKRIAGYETKIFREITGRNWITVVPTNLYGPNDNFNLEYSHLIPGLIHKAYLAKLDNTSFEVWGDGTPLRQFVYVDDLAKLIIDAIPNWNSSIPYMIINEEEVTIKDVAFIIADNFDIPKENIIFNVNKPNGQFRKPAKTDITNYQFTSLNSGIKMTIDWFVQNYSNIRK